MIKYFDFWTIAVIILTVIFFVTALFVKGFTHDLLLEAGVLLVSIKLIMMAYKNNLNYKDVKYEMNEIKRYLKMKNEK